MTFLTFKETVFLSTKQIVLLEQVTFLRFQNHSTYGVDSMLFIQVSLISTDQNNRQNTWLYR